jgi:hydroxymethylpyrimidine/phosphomethylpyrimidine kinase
MPTPPVVLSIAGYDPSSGAGVTADVKTAAAFDCFAVTCVTALTVQSTQGVFAVEPVRASVVRETLGRLQQDFGIAAVRIGMLGSGAVAEELAEFLESARLPNVVLDPVIRSSSGAALMDASGLEILRQRLLPLADFVTPNAEEAATLAGADPPAPGSSWESAKQQVRELATRLHALGARGVLITGGHLAEPVDFLSLRRPDGDLVREFRGEHLDSRSTHGTGCALATALACLLARGTDPVTAVAEAKEYVRQAIQQAYPLGKGVGPIHHLHRHRTES